MELTDLRSFCLSLPHATEDSAFGEDLLLFRVFAKIFVCVSLDDPDYLALKCDPDYAIELRDSNPQIQPAFHWNKKYWNQVAHRGNMRNDFLKSLIRHSYAQVVKNLPKKFKTEYPEILEIRD